MKHTLVCTNEACDRCGIRVEASRHRSSLCIHCGYRLDNYDDYEWEDDPAVGLPYDPDGVSPQFQAHLAELAKQAPNTPQDPQRVYSPAYQPQPSIPSTFSCPSDLSTCPVANKATVNVPWELYNQWIYLAREIDTEWIAFLKGTTNGTTYTITSMYFPPQRATGSFVEAQDGHIQPDTVAAVHSHVGMKVFFSQTDVEHANHPVELVVNRDGHILAYGRTKLECGRYHRGPAVINFTGSVPTSIKNQLKQVLQPANVSPVFAVK